MPDNLLDYQHKAATPNQKWVADFTCNYTAEGRLYLAAVLDSYTQHIVGWSVQERMTLQFMVDALMMVVWRGVNTYRNPVRFEQAQNS